MPPNNMAKDDKTAMTTIKTVSVTARNIQPSGRMVLSSRDRHILVDAPLFLEGLSENMTPLDLLLGSLATSVCFVCERVAEENGMPLLNISGLVEADYDENAASHGVQGTPNLTRVRLTTAMLGVTREQGEKLVEAIGERCPVYTTLNQAVEIEIVLVTN